MQTEFDVDAAFGTFVCTDKNDDWLNIYANYDIAEDRPCDTLELNLCKADGTEENWSYRLNAAEREVLLRKMEEYCQQQTGMSLPLGYWVEEGFLPTPLTFPFFLIFLLKKGGGFFPLLSQSPAVRGLFSFETCRAFSQHLKPAVGAFSQKPPCCGGLRPQLATS